MSPALCGGYQKGNRMKSTYIKNRIIIERKNKIIFGIEQLISDLEDVEEVREWEINVFINRLIDRLNEIIEYD